MYFAKVIVQHAHGHTLSGQSYQSYLMYTVYLRNRSPLAANRWVIIHCLEVSCKKDQITSATREWLSANN